jgi:hypothetical protein
LEQISFCNPIPIHCQRFHVPAMTLLLCLRLRLPITITLFICLRFCLPGMNIICARLGHPVKTRAATMTTVRGNNRDF